MLFHYMRRGKECFFFIVSFFLVIFLFPLCKYGHNTCTKENGIAMVILLDTVTTSQIASKFMRFKNSCL